MTLSPGAEVVALVVDQQRDRAGEHDRGLAAPGSCSGGSPAPAGGGAGLERVQRDVGALARQRRGQLLGAMTAAPARPALAGADDDHVAALVEAQQLREGQVEAGGDPLGDRQRRAGLAALDLREHRRRDAAALGEVAQREVHRLAQGLHPRSDGPRSGSRRASHRLYVITDARMLSRACVTPPSAARGSR